MNVNVEVTDVLTVKSRSLGGNSVYKVYDFKSGKTEKILIHEITIEFISNVFDCGGVCVRELEEESLRKELKTLYNFIEDLKKRADVILNKENSAPNFAISVCNEDAENPYVVYELGYRLLDIYCYWKEYKEAIQSILDGSPFVTRVELDI